MARSHYRTSVVLIITTTSAGIDHYVHIYWKLHKGPVAVKVVVMLNALFEHAFA